MEAIHVCTAWGPQGPDCLALAMELQPGALDAAAAEAASESPGSRGIPRVGHGWLLMNMSRMVDRYLGRPGARTRRCPGPPGRSSLPSAMLFLADPVRAAPTGAVTRSGPRRADARSRAYAGEKLLPAITSTGERFVESGNDHASDTEVLVVALLVILFEPSPYETQQRAALARARACAKAARSWVSLGLGSKRITSRAMTSTSVSLAWSLPDSTNLSPVEVMAGRSFSPAQARERASARRGP